MMRLDGGWSTALDPHAANRNKALSEEQTRARKETTKMIGDKPTSILTRAHSAFINYPRIQALSKDIELCQRTSQIAGEPHCIALEGPTGAGKTTMLQRYTEAYPPRDGAGGTDVPVLYVQTPSPITVKGMVSTMLEELGDPAAHRGTQAQLDSRLVYLLSACSVELVILDDFHNLTYVEKPWLMASVSNWLKAMIKKSGVPFLVVGIEGKVEPILQTNPELSRLFAVRETLYPFAWSTRNEGTIKEFATFIGHAERAAGMPLTEALPRVDLLHRLHYATDGVVANIMNLLRYAQVLAIQRGAEAIELDDLAAAFQKRLSQHVSSRVNPFIENEDGVLPTTQLPTPAKPARSAPAYVGSVKVKSRRSGDGRPIGTSVSRSPSAN